MNALNKRRIDEKRCGVYSRAAFNNIFACSCGVYSSNYSNRVAISNNPLCGSAYPLTSADLVDLEF